MWPGIEESLREDGGVADPAEGAEPGQGLLRKRDRNWTPTTDRTSPGTHRVLSRRARSCFSAAACAATARPHFRGLKQAISAQSIPQGAVNRHPCLGCQVERAPRPHRSETRKSAPATHSSGNTHRPEAGPEAA